MVKAEAAAGGHCESKRPGRGRAHERNLMLSFLQTKHQRSAPFFPI